MGGIIAESDIGHQERKCKTDHLTEVAEEALDGIGCAFLLLVDDVADHHLERLHGHVE